MSKVQEYLENKRIAALGLPKLEIGSIVKPTKESKFILRSGSGQYDSAIVVSIDPFVLVSEETDMRWSATIKKEYFEVIGTTDDMHLKQCMHRL